MTASSPGFKRSARKAKGHGHLRRGEIIEAAERIFVAEGYEGATIRRIADEVGVSPTALYLHFPDKHAILMEICDRAVDELHERNKAIAAQDIDARERVSQMLEAYAEWGLSHPNAYQLVYCTPRPVSAGLWSGETADLSAKCYEIFLAAVRELESAGRLRTGSAELVAQALWTACHGFVALQITWPRFAWSDPKELQRVSLSGIMDGLIAA